MSTIDLAPLIERMRNAFEEVETKLAAPDAFSDREQYVELSREHQRLSALLTSYDKKSAKQQELAESRDLLAGEEDEEFRSMIEAEIPELEAQLEALSTAVMSLILPPLPNDSRNSIVEIRPAAGGDEAALFAGALLRAYSRFAEDMGWQIEVLTLTESDLGGIRDVSFSLQGDSVFRFMQFESGVHRVQRVPATEAAGRIHTSTVTVAVLPEAQEVDVQIRNEDVRMDVFRASGPGGQCVNTTDSAVRLTHTPTVLVVVSQQEKSQHRNREIAMRILCSRLLEQIRSEEAEKTAEQRRSQVGTGERSERIRTYNFPQNRVTDHRYGITRHNLPDVMEGSFRGLMEEILAAENQRRLEAEFAQVGEAL